MLKLPFIKSKPFKFAIILSVILLVFAIFFYRYEKKSEPYRSSVKFIESNKELTFYLGKIKKYNFEKTGRSGWRFEKRYYHVRLNGEKTTGMIYLFFERNESGNWKLVNAELLLTDGRLIHLST